MPIRCAIVLALAGAALTAAAEPTSDFLRFTRLTTLEHMGRIDVNPVTGEIAVGATGPGFGSAQHARVIGTDGSVRTIGAAVPDPDAVAWDTAGLFAEPGSLLVGGVGGIFAAQPSGATPLVFGAGIDFENPEDMTIAPSGDLLFADYHRGVVTSVTPGGSFATVAVSSMAVNQVAASPSGEVLFGDQAGIASAAEPSGRVLEAGGPQGFITALAFGDGSRLWGEDAYGVNRTTGELLRFGETGAEVIASGLFPGVDPLDASRMPAADIGFLPSGEMVVAVPATGAVWTVVPAPSSVALLALGGLTAARRRRR